MSVVRHELVGILLVIAVAALTQGCASPGPPPPDENQLLAAGFRVLVAKTPQQQEHLQSLPPGKVTELQRTGVHYFVYPVAAKNQLYVGTPKEYAAYQRLRPGDYATQAQRQTADMASYNKQDASMQNNTNRDMSDPYFFWPTFDNLGWQ